VPDEGGRGARALRYLLECDLVYRRLVLHVLRVALRCRSGKRNVVRPLPRASERFHARPFALSLRRCLQVSDPRLQARRQARSRAGLRPLARPDGTRALRRRRAAGPGAAPSLEAVEAPLQQSAIVAERLSKLSSVPHDPLALEKRRATKSQGEMPSAKARRRNVLNAFRVPPEKAPQVRGRNILLIDDVFTTGATLNACARALKRAGAARVDALTLARVVRPQSGAI